MKNLVFILLLVINIVIIASIIDVCRGLFGELSHSPLLGINCNSLSLLILIAIGLLVGIGSIINHKINL